MNQERLPYNSSELRPVGLRSLLNTVVQDALFSQSRGPGAHSHSIMIQTFVRGSSMIHGCRQELEELFLNLILNALEAMPDGGDIYLTIEEGAGMARVYIQHNGDSSAPGVMAGASGGLDLKLCHAIVRRHKGEMDVRTQKGRATMIVVRLPLAGPDASTRRTVSKKASKDSHIVVIGKNSILTGLLQPLLADRVGRVSVIGSCRQGRRILKESGADLIIADRNALPHDAGNVVRGIKAEWPGLPVVIINAAHAIESADLVVTRPLNMDRFLLQINRLMRKGADSE